MEGVAAVRPRGGRAGAGREIRAHLISNARAKSRLSGSRAGRRAPSRSRSRAGSCTRGRRPPSATPHRRRGRRARTNPSSTRARLWRGRPRDEARSTRVGTKTIITSVFVQRRRRRARCARALLGKPDEQFVGKSARAFAPRRSHLRPRGRLGALAPRSAARPARPAASRRLRRDVGLPPPDRPLPRASRSSRATTTRPIRTRRR